jgi:hypothetical protein
MGLQINIQNISVNMTGFCGHNLLKLGFGTLLHMAYATRFTAVFAYRLLEQAVHSSHTDILFCSSYLSLSA